METMNSRFKSISKSNYNLTKTNDDLETTVSQTNAKLDDLKRKLSKRCDNLKEFLKQNLTSKLIMIYQVKFLTQNYSKNKQKKSHLEQLSYNTLRTNASIQLFR